MTRAAAGLVSRLLLLKQQSSSSSSSLRSNAIRVVALGGQQRLSSTLVPSGGDTSITKGISKGAHTAKWMTKLEKKSPQELIAEVPPIEVGARVVACEGGRDPSLGHPVEYICLDLPEPNPCKYCGLRYVQTSHDHHH